jgi:hypothetical protein
VAAATGLLWWPVGAAASAVGLVCLTVGAVLIHRRAGDPPAKLAPPAAVAVMASAAAMRQLATGS